MTRINTQALEDISGLPWHLDDEQPGRPGRYLVVATFGSAEEEPCMTMADYRADGTWIEHDPQVPVSSLRPIERVEMWLDTSRWSQKTMDRRVLEIMRAVQGRVVLRKL